MRGDAIIILQYLGNQGLGSFTVSSLAPIRVDMAWLLYLSLYTIDLFKSFTIQTLLLELTIENTEEKIDKRKNSIAVYHKRGY